MEKTKYTILQITSGNTYNIPIFLHNSIDEMGIMVGFDGYMGQIEQQCNFTYSGNTNTVTIFNTVNTTSFPMLVEYVLTINWGDNSSLEPIGMAQIGDINLPTKSHVYSSDGIYTIEVSINTPWPVKKISKEIRIPFLSGITISPLGTVIFDVPYTDPVVQVEQPYFEYYETQTGLTEDATFSFRAVGSSRISELKEYGATNKHIGVVVMDGVSGYTLDGLNYFDYPDGSTIISGSTASFYTDEVYNGMITRNEYFIGFVEDITIYSDIFVDRGKQGVMEKNLRLSEIESTGELDIYGNGYFIIRKQ